MNLTLLTVNVSSYDLVWCLNNKLPQTEWRLGAMNTTGKGKGLLQNNN